MKNNIRKSISVLLSVLMVLSVFGGMVMVASAEGVSITVRIDSKDPALDLPAEVSLEVELTDTGASVKEKLSALLGASTDCMILWAPNGVGINDDETLADRYVEAGATLRLSIDAPVNWVRVYTSAEGRENGDLYVDFASVEESMQLMLERTLLADFVAENGLGNNIARSFFVYLTEKFSEDWNDAVQRFCDTHSGYTPDSDVFDPAGGGWPLYDTEDIFYENLRAKDADVIAAINEDLGVELISLDSALDGGLNEQESLAMAFLEKYHADLITAAEDGAASTAAQLKAAEWYIDANHTNSFIAKVDGEEWPGASYYGMDLMSTLNEVGTEWKPIVVTEDPTTLNNGDYYLPRSFLLDLISDEINDVFGDNDTITDYDPFTGQEITYTKEEYIAEALGELGDFFINVNATTTSLFRYKETITMEHPYYGETTHEMILPFSERGYSFYGMVTAAMLDASVLLYHPEHVFGDWVYVDADNHSHTCSICGEVETGTHDVILKGAGDATCGDQGYTGDEYCSLCGEKLSEGEIIQPTGNHTTELVGAREATATEDGYTGDEVCTVCGQTIKTGEVIPATGSDTPDTPDDGGDCPYCGKHHTKIWVKIIHILLWFFQRLIGVFKK